MLYVIQRPDRLSLTPVYMVCRFIFLFFFLSFLGSLHNEIDIFCVYEQIQTGTLYTRISLYLVTV